MPNAVQLKSVLKFLYSLLSFFLANALRRAKIILLTMWGSKVEVEKGMDVPFALVSGNLWIYDLGQGFASDVYRVHGY